MIEAVLDEFLATPAIWLPGMDEGDWQDELDRMLQRSRLTHQFVDGALSPDDYMEGLYELGIDPLLAADNWEEGFSYLP
ncbi:MAG: hypothetical protein F6K28_15740 [Microcoleus sp. SIO2G3]|nr:hypothetical protein [Microcoleus sp. SIO2G3]